MGDAVDDRVVFFRLGSPAVLLVDTHHPEAATLAEVPFSGCSRASAAIVEGAVVVTLMHGMESLEITFPRDAGAPTATAMQFPLDLGHAGSGSAYAAPNAISRLVPQEDLEVRRTDLAHLPGFPLLE